MTPLTLHAEVEQWPLIAPFRITGYTWHHLDVLLVRLESAGHVGRAEAAGIYYKNETPTRLLDLIEHHRRAIEAGITRDALQKLLPPGGARNALDCALWDLEAKLTSRSVWQLLGLQAPRPILTTMTCGADTPEKVTATARAYTHARAIKIKLTGEGADADRVRGVREARPDVWLGVDANQGFTRASLEELMPVLVDARVSVIEQPFPVGQEALLDGFQSPIPVAADESLQNLSDIPRMTGRFNVLNIKLDKCGGLTEAIAMTRAAHAQGFDTMIGNMLGTSLAMAPAFLVAQLCNIVDLDGPIFLKTDRPHIVDYTDGYITCPPQLWGHPGVALQLQT